ncbi:hypothetical protein HMPREF1582_00793 [Gardnerella vaginalis JCP8151A]|nr:hypothetical protein HMPREF1582_00793 [Gardnerella vaginalis JCP8151A]
MEQTKSQSSSFSSFSSFMSALMASSRRCFRADSLANMTYCL